MSFTSFLTDKEVKEKFAQEFQLPDFNLKKEMVAAPLTNHFILLGVAFDYLLRFYLKYLNPDAITTMWVAEKSMGSLFDKDKDNSFYKRNDVWKVIGRVVGKSRNSDMSPYSFRDVNKILYIQRIKNGEVEQLTEYTGILKLAQKIIEEAKENYSSFLASGKLTDELIKSAIKLAQLEPIYRSGYLDANIGVVDEKDVEDLRKLISSVNPENFKALSICLLNPTFGEASRMVRGGDADLLIDDTLIDIKTTKFLKFDRKMFNQLIGYYILYKIGGIGELLHQPKIKKLGIYYSRFNKLYTFDVSDIMDENTLTNFTDWFKVKAKNIFG